MNAITNPAYAVWDPDWYEAVLTSTPCTCGGNLLAWTCVAPGCCNASASMMMVPRSPEDYAKIKAEKQRAHEEAILAEADAIRARRCQG